MRPSSLYASLLLLGACGRDVPRESLEARRAERAPKHAPVQYDTAVYVAQAGEPTPAISAVMQLRVAARDAQVTIENVAGQQALAGAIGGDLLEEIPGSHAASVALLGENATPVGWHTTVSVPVLEGERYLVELYPSSAREDSATIELSADARRLMTARVATDATDGTPPLFEVSVGKRSLWVSPQIERVEIVPTCGISHVVRSGGRADLFAQYEVIETGETGDVRLPPRTADAQYRGITFRTKTRGGVRITYLGRELASAAMPEGCGAVVAP